MIRFFGGKVLALNGNFDITNDEVWIDANKIVYVGPKKDVEKFEREYDLNKAAELLGKRYGLYTEKVDLDADTSITVCVDYGGGE